MKSLSLNVGVVFMTLLLASCAEQKSPAIPTLSEHASTAVSSSASSHSSGVSSGPEVLEMGDAEGAPALPGATSAAVSPLTDVPERLSQSGALELGKSDAPIVLLVFLNHASRYSGDFMDTIVPRLLQDFVMKGTVRLDLAILPLEKYPQTRLNAVAALCAAAQGKGLAMNRLLFEKHTTDQATAIIRAKSLSLDLTAFKKCQDDPATEKMYRSDERMSRNLNVTLVPTIILDGHMIIGLPSYADLRGQLEAIIGRRS